MKRNHTHLLISLVVYGLFAFLLPGAPKLTEPSERIRGDNETGREHGSASAKESITIGVLVLVVPGPKDVVLALRRHSDGCVDGVGDGTLDLVGRGPDDGKRPLHSAQTIVGQRIGLVHVRRHVLIRTPQIR